MGLTELIAKNVIEIGIIKFYLLGIGLLTILFLNLPQKKTIFTKITIISSFVLLLITISFIVLAYINS